MKMLINAVEGKVQSVFIDKDAELYGTYDPKLHKVSIHQEKQEASQSKKGLVSSHPYLSLAKLVWKDPSQKKTHSVRNESFDRIKNNF